LPSSAQPHPISEGEDQLDEGADNSPRSDISGNGHKNAPASPASASASASTSTSNEPYKFDDDKGDEEYDDPHDGEFVRMEWNLPAAMPEVNTPASST
jgi:hypothetical protein